VGVDVCGGRQKWDQSVSCMEVIPWGKELGVRPGMGLVVVEVSH
jgi:hypothetical protein